MTNGITAAGSQVTDGAGASGKTIKPCGAERNNEVDQQTMPTIEDAQKSIKAAVEGCQDGNFNFAQTIAQIAQAEAMIIIAEKLRRISSVLEAHTGYYTESGFEDLGSPKGPGQAADFPKSPIDDGLPY